MMLVGGAGGEVMWVVRSSFSGVRQREKEDERESPSRLAEVVGVHPLHLVGALQRYAHAVVDHEVGERLPVDQDHLVREPFGVLEGTIGELGGGDEDPLPGILTVQCPHELLYLRSAHCILPPLGLNIDYL